LCWLRGTFRYVIDGALIDWRLCQCSLVLSAQPKTEPSALASPLLEIHQLYNNLLNLLNLETRRKRTSSNR